MITSFRHKGLKKLFETGNTSGVHQDHVDRIRRILALLETASSTEDMDLPGLKLHQLRGKRKGTWAVAISGNWRITFKFNKGDVIGVDYEDYH